MNLIHKTIWITGASSGIGASTSIELARDQTNLILSGRQINELEKTRQQCLDAGANDVLLLPFETTDFERLPEIVEQAEQWKGGVDILFNNAGVSQRALIRDTEFKVYRTLMEVDYFAPVALSLLLLPKMIARGGGQFMVTSSMVGLFGFKLRAGYSAAKHALHGFFDTVRSEHDKDNIKVLMVLPGYIKTNISYAGLKGDGSAQGEMDAEQATSVGPDVAAKQIVKALKKGNETVYAGKGFSAWAPYVHRFLPFIFKRIQRK